MSPVQRKRCLVVSEDAGYENGVELFTEGKDLRVRKVFQRRERFLAEVSASLLLQKSGRVPRLREICEQHLVLVRDWAPGNAPKLLDIPRRLAALRIRRIAACLKDVHACVAPCWGPLEQRGYSSWLDYLRQRLELRLAQAGPRLKDERRLREWASARMLELRVPTMPVVLHHDLKPANILLSLNSVVLVDLEHAKGGDRLSDLAKLKWRTFDCDRNLWNLFVEEYGGIMSNSISERSVDFYLAMHCLGAVAYSVCSGSSAYARHSESASLLIEALVARA